MNYIIIDQGTSSTKGFLINPDGQVLHSNKINYKLDNPKPFHFECNPMSIFLAIAFCLCLTTYSKKISAVFLWCREIYYVNLIFIGVEGKWKNGRT